MGFFSLLFTDSNNKGIDFQAKVTLGISVFVAASGYAAKYWNDIRIAKRKDRLDRINQQLKLLYGPLYALDRASGTAWQYFRSRYRSGIHYFREEPNPPTEDDLAAWRLWMCEVFMPLILRMEKTIVENADLLIEERMPKCFLTLSAHIATYKPVLEQWKQKDYRDLISMVEYPSATLRDYIERSFKQLKKEQNKLLGLLIADSRNRS